jgi:hypothetical protein
VDKIRKIGAGFLTLGLILGAGCWVLVRAGIGASALLIVVAPPMIAIGLAMIIAPGDDHGHHDIDFTDWFELLPTGRRVSLYVIALVTMGLGLLMLLHLGNWSFEGVLELVL